MILVRYSLELAGIEPHSTAMRAGFDLDTMIFAAGQIVPILRAFHVMGLSLRLRGSRVSALPLLSDQLRFFPGEVFILVPAWLVRLH
jgi:hypothetical protein